MTIALDLLGGDGAPDVVADAIALLLESPEPCDLMVVGPLGVARPLLDERGITERVQLVDAGRGASMAENPLSVLREHHDLTVSVGVGLVQRGVADAFVSFGHTGATVAAAVLGLGRLFGISRPALAVVMPALAGPVVLVDAGAGPDATPDVLRQFALAGWAYARSIGIEDPGVGLLSIGSEAGKGDQLRRSTDELLSESLDGAGVRYVGLVEGHDVALGASAQVIVTDGFTGNVLLKGLEGAVRWSATRMGAAYEDPEPAHEVARATATSDFAGGLLLGVKGVVVIGHGAGTAEEIRACVRLAERAAGQGVVAATQSALASVVRA